MSLPHLEAPRDVMRFGLGQLRDEVTAAHPVEEIQRQRLKEHEGLVDMNLGRVYGSAFPAQLHMERQILSKVKRLPGLPSSHLGLQSMMGTLDELAVEDVVGYGDKVEIPLVDLHEMMEYRLGLAVAPPRS
ncbi:hypothetical protein CLOM_g3029 [Closterium sp. NIES-68]|nr:hypothetical protein CLOM_g3029 [Closterium sp. NIES-68]GJP82357.1 hypothetical protein CLOP_g12605 [Closterium sp. NIES-67]GJP86531.1 hypothetical protein CLOP_g16545 [Closterium sp. NIES-67]